MGSIHHPNLVAIYDVGQIGGACYLAMELIEGPSLAEVIDDFRTAPVAAKLVYQLARAAVRLHAFGMFHGEIDPSHVKIDSSGKPKLLSAIPGLPIGRLNNPVASAFPFTRADYVSPEQRNEMDVDVQSDVYDLGALLYRILSGKPPRSPESIPDTPQTFDLPNLAYVEFPAPFAGRRWPLIRRIAISPRANWPRHFASIRDSLCVRRSWFLAPSLGLDTLRYWCHALAFFCHHSPLSIK